MGVKKEVRIPDIGDFENVEIIEILVSASPKGNWLPLAGSVDTVELKLKSANSPLGSAGWVSITMITVPQLLMLTVCGAMKSFKAEVKESEERLFR